MRYLAFCSVPMHDPDYSATPTHTTIQSEHLRTTCWATGVVDPPQGSHACAACYTTLV